MFIKSIDLLDNISLWYFFCGAFVLYCLADLFQKKTIRNDQEPVQSEPNSTSRKYLRTKVTPDFHLTYSKNGGNLGLESK